MGLEQNSYPQKSKFGGWDGEWAVGRLGKWSGGAHFGHHCEGDRYVNFEFDFLHKLLDLPGLFQMTLGWRRIRCQMKVGNHIHVWQDFPHGHAGSELDQESLLILHLVSA